MEKESETEAIWTRNGQEQKWKWIEEKGMKESTRVAWLSAGRRTADAHVLLHGPGEGPSVISRDKFTNA